MNGSQQAAGGIDFQGYFAELQQQLIRVHVEWAVFLQLYGSSPERVDLLNRTCPSFFMVVQFALLDSILLGIGRMTDSARTCGRDNLTFSGIEPLFPIAWPPALAMDLRDRIRQLELQRDAIRLVRHRRLAHLDLRVALSLETLPAVDRSTIETVLRSMREILNLIQDHIDGSVMDYTRPVLPGDGETLAHFLEIAVESMNSRGRGLQQSEGTP